MRAMSMWFASVALTGCFVADGELSPVSRVDEGELCFENQGSDVVIEVIDTECVSSSCVRDIEGGCEAVVDGATLTLTSDISYAVLQPPPDVGCTPDCVSVTVSCTVEGLADGTYTVVHGADEVELVVPVQEECSFSGARVSE
jgi:hypothetical protein